MAHILSAVLAAFAISASYAIAAPQDAAPAIPTRLDGYFTKVVRMTPSERSELLRGLPVTRLLDADQSKEVAVFGAIWVDAPMQRYIDAVTDIETFESGGGFRVTKKISTPPRLEDFNRMHLPPEDVADLRTCRVGHCEVKLGERAFERLRSEVDWKAANPQALIDAAMQRLAFDYANEYLEGGNARLAVYRDTSRPTFVAEEFRAMVAGMPELTSYLPDLRRYLLEYPAVTLPDATSFLYWQDAEFGLKPTIRISHVTIRQAATDAVVMSKMLYASHYFWTGLELRVLVSDPSRGTGFWFVTVSRSRSDGLSGFTGMVIRGRVQDEVQKGVLAGLRSTKQRLEASR